MVNQQKKNRLLILIIFGMSIVPFLIAFGLNKYPDFLKGRTNHGDLITPPLASERRDFVGYDQFSTENIKELIGHWLILNIIPGNHCNKTCLDALLKTRQLRLMLNKDLPRTRRVVIVTNAVTPEIVNQWWLKEALLWRLNRSEKSNSDLYDSLLLEENKLDDKLITILIGNEKNKHVTTSDLIKVKVNETLLKKIAMLKKGSIPDGMLFLMDPLGNIMMQYEPGFDPYKVKSDLMHLLRISQVG